MHLASPCSCTSKGCAQGRREDFFLDCYLGDSVGLGQRVASKVIGEHLFSWCCHKYLLASESELTDFLWIMCALCYTLIWFFSGKVQFAAAAHFIPICLSGGAFRRILFGQSCLSQLGSVYQFNSKTQSAGTLWSFTCFLSDFASFPVNPTLRHVYKLLLILSVSVSSSKFSSKPAG